MSLPARRKAVSGIAANLHAWDSHRPSMRVELGSEADILEGKPKCVTVNQRTFALYKVGGTIYCLDNRCTHMGGPLCQGSLQDSVVTCPWHGSRFDVRTGQVVGPPARVPAHANALTVEGGKVFVEVP